jgi:hypothetical protein
MTKVVNKYAEPYDVYIGRGSIWGNPFSHKTGTLAQFIVSSREESISKYYEYFLNKVKNDEEFRNKTLALKGKVLGCFCKPLPCHGDIIVQFLEGRVTGQAMPEPT